MAKYQSLSDQELLIRLNNADYQAFSILYARYVSIVYHFLFRFLKSPELTDDLTQEVFIKLWEKQAETAKILSLKSYLLTLAKHHAFNFLKRASLDVYAKAEILKHYHAEENNVEDSINTIEYEEFLCRALNKLTPQNRKIFFMCRQMGNTYEETAAILGISRNAVKKHMVKSIKVLGESVKHDLGISFSIFIVYLMSFLK